MNRIFKFPLTFFLLVAFSLSAISQADIAKVEKYIEKAQKDWDIPGMAVAIVKDGKIVLNKGFGVLKLGEGKQVDENTLFAIASNSKAFISSALAVLVEEGKINWDDKVRQYLPYFELYDDYVSNETTIRDLLCHRVGLGTFSGDVIWFQSERSEEDIVKKAKYIPQKFGFRSGFGYSNIMYIAAGEVIRKATGKHWGEFVQETFFNPLKMDRTIISINDLDKMGNYAIPHKVVDGQNREVDWVRWDNSGAAGGIISSANDMAKWLVFNLNNGIVGKDTILHPDQQNILWTIYNSRVISRMSKEDIPGRHFNGYGLGWALNDYYGRMIVSHGGGYDGMYSKIAMVPDENLGMVILTNTMKDISTPLMYYIINAYINKDNRDWSHESLKEEKWKEDERVTAIKKARVLNTNPTAPLEAYVGDYYSDMFGNISIKQEDGQLTLYFEKAPKLLAKLEHWHYDVWEIKWDRVHAWFDFGIVQFKLDENLAVTGMFINVPNEDIFFHELEIKRVKQIP